MTSCRRSVLLLLFLAFVNLVPVAAQRSTTNTYTPNPRGTGYFTRTGDAYLPEFTFTNLGLKEPEDLFIDESGMLYIADSGNRRVLLFDSVRGQATAELVHPDFISPSGVWIDSRGLLYVADPKAEKVLIFDSDLSYLRSMGRPGEAAYGDRSFAPRKVAVDDSGNLYLVSEGLYDGIIQLSPLGNFLGYFTSNRVNLSFTERLQDLLFTDEQKANLLGKAPVTFSNIYLDARNILYTSSIGDADGVVKKHNTAGVAIVEGSADEESAPVDIWVNSQGIMVLVFADGETIIYSSEGDVIATFGYSMSGADVAGLFATPSSLAMDSKGTLWYLDRESNFLQSYVPTEYILNIYEALDLFDRGEYRRSIELWQEVLKVNQLSRIAHLSLGKNYLFLKDYEQAMYHTRIANSRLVYSDAFWEIRNIWLQKNIMYLVLLLVLAFILPPVWKLLRRHYPRLQLLSDRYHALGRIPWVEALSYQWKVMRHPADAWYYVRKGRKGTLWGALVLIFIFFVIFMVSVAGKGFIYQTVQVEDIDFTSVVIGFFGAIGLFILANYLGTSVNDGRGTAADLVKVVGYSSGPLMLALLLSTGLSYVLTFNEVFALQIISIIGWSWWIVIMVMGIKEIHQYRMKEALGSIFFSLMFMLVLIIVMVIITVMAQQLYQFVTALFKELMRNVR